MTLRYVDGYDYIPSGASQSSVQALLSAAGYYLSQQPDHWFAAAGRFGFRTALRHFGNPTAPAKMVRPIAVPANITHAWWGFSINVGNDHNTVGHYFALYDALSDAPQLSISLQPYGVIKAFRGYPSSGTLLGASRAGVYYDTETAYMEIAPVIDPSAGSVEVRINTVPVLSIPTVNTQNTSLSGFDSIAVGNDTGNQVFDVTFDDMYLNDDAGSVNNGYLGNVRVHTQFPAGPGDLSQFTPFGAAANWQAALNQALDDTLYNGTSTTGNEDLYAVEAILGARAVHGVQLRSAMRQTDATQRTARNRLKMGGVDTDSGTDHYLNQTFTFYHDIIELNPSTGLGMTGTQLNAAQIGPRVTG